MGADMRSVHPDIGVMEHGAEAQEYAIADPILRQLEGAAVDSDSGSATQIVELRLPWPGDLDAARLGVRNDARCDMPKFPEPIETNA